MGCRSEIQIKSVDKYDFCLKTTSGGIDDIGFYRISGTMGQKGS